MKLMGWWDRVAHRIMNTEQAIQAGNCVSLLFVRNSSVQALRHTLLLFAIGFAVVAGMQVHTLSMLVSVEGLFRLDSIAALVAV